jgi:tetratricopeptide (TPR) repeat protein
MNVWNMKAMGVNKQAGRAGTFVLGGMIAVAVLMPPFVIGDNVDAARGGGAAVLKPKIAGDVVGLVAKLSDDAYLVREQAMTNLWKMGMAALPALRQAAAAGDPEIADRANELILYISVGVLVDSPEEIKVLVLKFSRSQIEEKLVILRKLMGLGQWKQVLHLAELEQSPDVRAKMSEIVKTTAARAARDAIVKGDYDSAAGILEIGADDVKIMVMRAWFYARRGELEKQLEKAADRPGENGALWRMSLHRAAGNVVDAIHEAEKAGRQDIADALRVFDGDARPWLRRGLQRSNLDAIYSMGYRIQLDRLEGKDKRAAMIARELVSLAVDDDAAARVSICLAANGFRKEAVGVIVRSDIDSAFEYYDITESPQRCLEMVGIPRGAKPPFTAWVKEFTDNAIEEEDEKLYNRLIALAGFLVSHGQGEHAKVVLTPLMTALEADGSDEWFDLLATMLNYGLGAEAFYFVEKRGNEDDEADLAVKKMFAQVSSKSLNHLWKALKKRNNQDVAKALHELALLSGVIADPGNETDELHKALEDDVLGKGAVDKDIRMMALFTFALKRNDMATASRMADTLAVANDRWTRSKVYLDAALLRWEKIEPYYAALAKKNPADYDNLTRWYITLRKLGREEQAEEMYERVLMLSMGGAEELNRIGWELHEAGYEEKAVDLWLRAAMVADPGKENYDRAIVYLAHYGQSIYRKKQWKKAVAIAEVNTQLMMRGRSGSLVHSILRTRFYAEFCQGMHLLQSGEKSRAISKLDTSRQLIPGDGTLADDFFPILREAGVGKHYDQWFEDSYRHVAAACKLYPKAHNSQNTAAWLAARSVRRLDDAIKHSEAALKLRPTQGAYLDTMAEVWFAKGNRAKAIEWSQKAIAGSISHAQGNPRRETMVLNNYKQLQKQHERFKSAPLPRAER